VILLHDLIEYVYNKIKLLVHIHKLINMHFQKKKLKNLHTTVQKKSSYNKQKQTFEGIKQSLPEL
jgi:hypothetical protein